MKTLFCLLLFLVVINVSAQRIELYFDHVWKPSSVALARFYSLIEKKENIWQRQNYFIRERILQMRANYLDSSCTVPHGSYNTYYSNRRMHSTGNYINGKKQGLWLNYHSNGMISDSTFFKNGIPTGTALGWHSNGFLRDSAVYNDDGSGIKFTWFDNGAPASAGKYVAGLKMHGKWQFFHKNGVKSAVETFDNGRMIAKEYYDEEGVGLTEMRSDRVATFKEGGEYGWYKHLNKEIYFPDRYKIENADQVVVVVDAYINENGQVTDAEVSVPFHPAFDRIALDAVRKSPKWTPAILHNTKVKYKISQAIFFAK